MMMIDKLSTTHAKLGCTIFATPHPTETRHTPAAAPISASILSMFDELWHPA